MKHIMNLFLIIALISIAMFTACSDDKTSNPSSLTIDQTEVDVLAIGGQTLINVITDLTWNATADADWIRISPASGNGSGIVNVEIDRHLGTRRTAKISFTAGAISKTVNILQRGQIPEMYFLSSDITTPIKDMTMAGEGGTEMVIVRTNLVDWTIDIDADWIHVLEIIDLGSVIIDDDGDLYYDGVINNNVMSTKAIFLSVDSNEDLPEREGAITFSYGNYYSDTLKVFQTRVRIYDSDGYFVVDKLPFRDKGKYELSAVNWSGQLGTWGDKFGILAYKVIVDKSGKLKIVDNISPTYNIWFLLYNDKEAADKGEHKTISEADGKVEYDVTPGTYYVFGIMNTWYDDIAKLTTIDYDVEITCE
ncbi:MAG: hypothetical protein LBS43_08645 [Prevotellaceae bacterium]|jgi:hypothetical protein|nr:hypothetical protein [Prevotellaceae bacterium]